MTRPTAIVFDAFGTLVQPRRGANAYDRLSAAAGGRRMPFLTRNVGADTFAEELGVGYLWPLIARELAAELSQLSLYEDVPPVLGRLRTRHKIAVCSNLAQPFGAPVRALLPGLDAYLLSFELGVKKPDPAIYQAACAALRCQPRDVLWIGDSRRADYEGPQACGMQARLIDRTAGHRLADVLRGID